MKAILKTAAERNLMDKEGLVEINTVNGPIMICTMKHCTRYGWVCEKRGDHFMARRRADTVELGAAETRGRELRETRELYAMVDDMIFKYLQIPAGGSIGELDPTNDGEGVWMLPATFKQIVGVDTSYPLGTGHMRYVFGEFDNQRCVAAVFSLRSTQQVTLMVAG